jgi:hypothetical protein
LTWRRTMSSCTFRSSSQASSPNAWLSEVDPSISENIRVTVPSSAIARLRPGRSVSAMSARRRSDPAATGAKPCLASSKPTPRARLARRTPSTPAARPRTPLALRGEGRSSQARRASSSRRRSRRRRIKAKTSQNTNPAMAASTTTMAMAARPMVCKVTAVIPRSLLVGEPR